MNFRTQKKISLFGLISTVTIYIMGLIVMLVAMERFAQAFFMIYDHNRTIIHNFEDFCSNNPAVLYLGIGITAVLGVFKILRALITLSIQLLNYKIHKTSVDQPAYTYGLLRPSIFIDQKISKEFDIKENRAIRLHEEYHQKSYDPLLLLLVQFSSNLLPFFPGKSRLYNTIFLLFELSADEYAFEQMNSKRPLLSSLMKIIRLKISTSNYLLASFSNITDERIAIHTNHTQFNFIRPFFHGAFILCFIFIIFINSARLNSSDAFVCEVPEDCSSFETKTLTCS